MTRLSNPLPFVKYSGCGNDFILIDRRKKKDVPDDEKWIQVLCRRKTGIGADGVILLEDSKNSDWRMRIFNADGKEAEMCGNGIRCLFRFLEDLGLPKHPYSIETGSGILHGEYTSNGVAIKMGAPTEIKWDIPIQIEEANIVVHHLNTGVQHACFFVEKDEEWDIESFGKKLRFHPAFQPQGANVNFIRKIDERTIRVRTYERGVEGETLACGTGACASALAFAYKTHAPSPVEVMTSTGEKLMISFHKDGNSFENLIMEGPAKKVFEGNITVDLNSPNKIE